MSITAVSSTDPRQLRIGCRKRWKALGLIMTETPTTRAFPACRRPAFPRQFPKAWVPPLIPRPENRWRAYSLSGTPAMRLCRVKARIGNPVGGRRRGTWQPTSPAGFENTGWKPSMRSRGDLGYQAALSRAYDLLIVDRMLPGMDGLESGKGLARKGL